MGVAQRCAAVARRATVPFDVGIDEVKQPSGVAEARSPDATRIRVPQHVELALAAERAWQQAPVRQVPRMVELHAGVPLERRRRDVVVLTHTYDGGVRVETGQDGVFNRRGLGHGAHSLRAFSRILKTIPVDFFCSFRFGGSQAGSDSGLVTGRRL
jgi:hypothetical protein